MRKNINMTRLAFMCMFDIDVKAARDYMRECACKTVPRDVSLSGAFKSADECLKIGVKKAVQKYPQLITNIENFF